MQKYHKKSLQFTLFIIVIASTVFSIPPSYADRMITIQKVSDVKEESLLNTISDVSQYSKIFPDNVKYVKILDNSTRLVDINAGINGIFLIPKQFARQIQMEIM